jgi:ribosomal protein S6--L-glutamate ligase
MHIPLRIAIVRDGVDHSQPKLAGALLDRGHDVITVTPDDLTFHDNTILAFGYPLIVDGVLFVTLRYGEKLPAIVRAFNRAGIHTLNTPEGSEIARNKLLSYMALTHADINCPPTELARSPEEVHAFADVHGYPLVLKDATGWGGEDVYRIMDRSETEATWAMFGDDATVLVQQYIECGGVDTRVLVLGGTAVSAMRRAATNPFEFRSNLKQGGEAKGAELTPDIRDIAERCAATTQLELCGVDIGRALTAPNGVSPIRQGDLFVFEINSLPGVGMIQRVTGLRVADMVVAYFTERIIASREASILPDADDIPVLFAEEY